MKKIYKNSIKYIYKNEYCKLTNNPISYDKFIEEYSRNKKSMEEVLKIHRFTHWWDRKSKIFKSN